MNGNKQSVIRVETEKEIPRNYTGIVYYRSDAWRTEDFVKEYYLDGKLHRIDGPARVYLSTFNFRSFYYKGICYTCESWFEKLTDEEKIKAVWNIDEWR